MTESDSKQQTAAEMAFIAAALVSETPRRTAGVPVRPFLFSRLAVTTEWYGRRRLLPQRRDRAKCHVRSATRSDWLNVFSETDAPFLPFSWCTCSPPPPAERSAGANQKPENTVSDHTCNNTRVPISAGCSPSISLCSDWSIIINTHAGAGPTIDGRLKDRAKFGPSRTPRSPGEPAASFNLCPRPPLMNCTAVTGGSPSTCKVL